MYAIAEPTHFFDSMDLNIESEWNTHYETSEAPMWEPTSPSTEFLYECSFCLGSHAPSAPCETGYSWSADDSEYTYLLPLVTPASQSTFLASNYRKWLVSVTPR